MSEAFDDYDLVFTGEKTGGEAGDIFRPRDMEMGSKERIRLLSGPLKRVSVYWDTVGKNDLGSLTFIGRSVNISEERRFRHLLSPIAALESELKKENNLDSTTPRIIAKTDFLYLGVVYSDDPLRWRIIEVSWKLQKQIEGMESAISENDPKKALFGPFILWDLTVSKKKVENKPYPFDREYSIDFSDPVQVSKVCGEKIPKGSTPRDILNTPELRQIWVETLTTDVKHILKDERKRLTELIERTREMVKPVTEEEFRKILMDAPVNLFAVRNGKNMFFKPNILSQRVAGSEADIPLLTKDEVISIEKRIESQETSAIPEKPQDTDPGIEESTETDDDEAFDFE